MVKRSTEAWERRISKQEERIKAIRAKYGKASSPDQQPSSISAEPTPTVPTPTPTTASPSISNASNKPNKKSNRKRSKEALERRAAKQRERIKAIRESYRKAPSPNQQPESISAAPTPTLPTPTVPIPTVLTPIVPTLLLTTTSPLISNANKKSTQRRSKEAWERRAAKKEKRMKEIREKYGKAPSPNQQPESISAAPTPTLITKVSAVEDSPATAPSFSNASQQPSLTSITQDPTTRDSPVAGPSNSDVNQQPKSAPTQDEDAAQERWWKFVCGDDSRRPQSPSQQSEPTDINAIPSLPPVFILPAKLYLIRTNPPTFMVPPQQVYASAVNRSASGSHHPDLVWPASINERIPSYAIVNQAFDEALPDRPSTPTQIPVPEIPETPTPNSRIAQVEGAPYTPTLGGYNGDDSGSSYLDSA